MDDVRTRLAELWAELLNAQEPTDSSDFFDCGGTSITAVYLAAGIQERFGVRLDALEVVLERTFGKLRTLVQERLSQAGQQQVQPRR